MAGVNLPDMRPWGRRPLTIPPKSVDAWIHLAIWEIWMGVIVCVVLGLGILLVAASPDRIVAVSDLTNCYGPPPVALPCERIVYRGGVMNSAFTALVGSMLLGLAGWLLWELWSAVEPKPITDDFLKLLDASFGRNWRNPLRWPWTRLLWAYGFALVGAALAAAISVTIWTMVASPDSTKVPNVEVETSAIFRLDR